MRDGYSIQAPTEPCEASAGQLSNVVVGVPEPPAPAEGHGDENGFGAEAARGAFLGRPIRRGAAANGVGAPAGEEDEEEREDEEGEET